MKASKEYFREYYAARKGEYIARLGGKCVKCGSTDKLQFDHIDPLTKEFPIGKLMNVSKAKAEFELAKCQLLCVPCHQAKTISDGRQGGGWNKGNITHGSSGYKQKCRCDICVQWNIDRNKHRNEQRRIASNGG